ncbi:sigma-70 family RNA polymerase sigma factor [Actinoplanes oblitus]|uniref:Sigma-70 family RNA polymerase sigma factor n=1 Tax=Actinoplanes oblitus TaxID=3040509 RepID=A0ABY8WRJ5_9ACTN|nr:sigma-70 family RNA polymerase sigma factor [Actinoplanes oblitus]WIN00088.1 sigma-70 family RNA polymerase sigma factor [Actinoplanes oblitus]
MLWRTAFGILQDRQKAEDAVQDTVVAMARHLRRYKRPPDSWRAWLTTVVTRRALNIRYRRLTFWGCDLDAVPVGNDPTFEAVYGREQRERIFAIAGDLLSKRDRAVLVLRADGFGNAEIAAAMKTTPKDVSNRYCRALAVLRRAMAAPDAAGPGLPRPTTTKGAKNHVRPGA